MAKSIEHKTVQARILAYPIYSNLTRERCLTYIDTEGN